MKNLLTIHRSFRDLEIWRRKNENKEKKVFEKKKTEVGFLLIFNEWYVHYGEWTLMY